MSENHSYSNILDIDVLMIVEHSGVNNSRRTDNGRRNLHLAERHFSTK